MAATVCMCGVGRAVDAGHRSVEVDELRDRRAESRGVAQGILGVGQWNARPVGAYGDAVLARVERREADGERVQPDERRALLARPRVVDADALQVGERGV